MQLKKTVNYDGQDYVLSSVTGAQAEGAYFNDENGQPLPSKTFTKRLILASLESGGNTVPIDFLDNMPLFLGGKYNEFQTAALIVNGMITDSGETQAEVSPATESTGS